MAATVLTAITGTCHASGKGFTFIGATIVGSTGLRDMDVPVMHVGFAVSTTTTLVAALAGRKIVVLGYGVTATATASVSLQSHVTTGVATGLRVVTAGSSIEKSYSPAGHFATVVGEALDIVTNAAVAGEIAYVYV